MIYKFLLLVLTISIIFVSCKKSDKRAFESIDLSVKSRHDFNSFRIGIDGKAIVLKAKICEIPKLYEVVYDEKEISYIEKELLNINLKKSVSMEHIVDDGAQYVLMVNNLKDTLTLLSSTYKESRQIDNLVLYIENITNKKKKKYYFKSVESLIPPPPPVVSNISSQK